MFLCTPTNSYWDQTLSAPETKRSEKRKSLGLSGYRLLLLIRTDVIRFYVPRFDAVIRLKCRRATIYVIYFLLVLQWRIWDTFTVLSPRFWKCKETQYMPSRGKSSISIYKYHYKLFQPIFFFSYTFTDLYFRIYLHNVLNVCPLSRKWFRWLGYIFLSVYPGHCNLCFIAIWTSSATFAPT